MKSTFGSWLSPVTSELIVSSSVGLSSPTSHNGQILWIESRPQEGGRNVLVRRDGTGQEFDVNPSPYNIRTRVHEYGGGAWLVHDNTLYFSNFSDQQVYRQAFDEDQPTQLSHHESLRFADGCMDANRGRIIYVIEDHSPDGEAENKLGALDINSGEVTILATGHDFYASPAMSPDGSQLSYMTWDHPDMPWDETIIWQAGIDADGDLTDISEVAGGQSSEQKISVQQPRYSPAGQLYYISDESGWWNIYRDGQAISVCPLEAEFGSPHWGFGLCSYLFLDEDSMVCNRGINNVSQLAILDLATGQLRDIDLPYSNIGGLSLDNRALYTAAASPVKFAELVNIDLESSDVSVVKQSMTLDIEEGYLSVPETIEFPTADDETSHAFYYPPTNKDYEGEDGEAPPLIVMMHGGPTGAVFSTLSLRTQFWTSRGFAVADINYRGSTGYGRQYRDKLLHQWGIVDVEDADHCARYLASKNLADAKKLAIRGGSAGGYTTLSALTFTDTFSAGASHFGVSDLEALAKDTHKFESRYLDSMIGAYPEEIDVYHARSPVHHAEALSSPCIFFQGLEDRVVPPNQAEIMVDSLTEKGIPVAYVPFEGEQHGFRIADNIKRCLDLELYFYSRIFGFTAADQIEPIQIINLDP